MIKSFDEALKIILKQEPLAIFQGKGELGPRALGNRSILFDPRNPNAKDILNKFKNREWWRPIAATIMLEYVNEYFDMQGLKESPFMAYAIKAKEKALKETPSIIHADNTCRIQTLKEEDNPNYYKLIKMFYEKTNVPILCNTSLNLAGYPIVENINQIKQIKNLFLP
jgi:carbamoyltransferase